MQKIKFKRCTQFIAALSIDFETLEKLNWTTHLYGLYSVAWYCVNNNIEANSIQANLTDLYSKYFNNKANQYSYNLMDYKNSCSSRTRSAEQRQKRLKAILNYCTIQGS